MTKKQGINYNQPSTGSFDIHGVVYRGERGTYRLFEKMTPVMNQKQLAELYEAEKQKGNPHPIDAPLIWAIVSAGHSLRNADPRGSERLKQFLRQSLMQYSNTLTRVKYFPSGKDRIIHNYATSDQYSLTGKIVGQDGRISEISDKKFLESLLGIKDVSKVDHISRWVNETDSSIWRLNSKPKKLDERVVGLFAVSVGLDFLCNMRPLSAYPAFRVLKVD